jgi:hypothetical protein
MSAKVTPWFTTPEAAPGRFGGQKGVNPARVGWYHASVSRNSFFRYWNGSWWSRGGYFLEDAQANRTKKPGKHKNTIKHWRGLTRAEYVRLGGALPENPQEGRKQA